MKKSQPTFNDFLTYFEEIIPPILITDETIENIKGVVKPLHPDLINEFIVRWEGEIDEFTEIIPCFALPQQDEYRALVYWKASLLRYEYIIATLDKSNTLISKKTICGTVVEGEIIKKSVAQIDHDLIIHIQAGASFEEHDYDPEQSQAFSIEIMPSGEMLFHVDENNEDYKNE
jgi:hypothetical protein